MKTLLFSSVLFYVVMGLFLPHNTYAAQTVNPPPVVNCKINPNDCKIPNPLNVDSISGLINILLDTAIKIAIPIAVLFLVFAGFKYVTAQGDPTKIQSAHGIFLWTMVGLAVVLGASLLAKIIKGTLESVGYTF